jgi:hypothetical protein
VTTEAIASVRRVAPIAATVLVLAALAADRALFRPVPAVADAHHARVRAAVESLPRYAGPWLGADAEVPPAAIKLLQPNAIVSREFRNIESGERVTLVLVHVRDARDILGHYPPVCYPSQGWVQTASRACDWRRPGRVLHGSEYTFVRDRLEGTATTVVDNFLVIPGGQTFRDMTGVEVAAQDRLRKLFGAGQVQFVHDGGVAPERRHQIVEELLGLLDPVLVEISNRESL